MWKNSDFGSILISKNNKKKEKEKEKEKEMQYKFFLSPELIMHTFWWLNKQN